VHTLAHLGLARAYVVSGVPGAAREAYGEFFDRLATADPDLPILRIARDELAGL
jgi:hypothetical protein